MKPLVFVVVPAHNEEDSIVTCLVALIQQRAECTIEVIIVANGCTDRTADLARDLSAQARDTDVRLHALEIDEASKSAALNAGESAGTVALPYRAVNECSIS